VPAGHLDGGETVTQAAIREAREEIGIELSPEDVAVAGTMHRKSRTERAPSNCEPDKCDDLLWAPLGTLPANTCPASGARSRTTRARTWRGSRSSGGDGRRATRRPSCAQRAAVARPVGQATPVPPSPQ